MSRLISLTKLCSSAPFTRAPHYSTVVLHMLKINSFFITQQKTSLIYLHSFYNPSYSRIFICFRLWSIRRQMHDCRHHNNVFPSAVLKWGRVLRIKIIFYVTGQTLRYKKVLPRYWTGSRSSKKKDIAVSFRKWSRKNSRAVSVGSLARLNHAQNWSLSRI